MLQSQIDNHNATTQEKLITQDEKIKDMKSYAHVLEDGEITPPSPTPSTLSHPVFPSKPLCSRAAIQIRGNLSDLLLLYLFWHPNCMSNVK